MTSSATQPSVNAEAEGALAAATPDQSGTSSDLPEAEQTPQPQTLPAQTPPTRDPASVKLVWAQFAESPVSGDADKTVLYGGKLDAYLDLSGATFGLDDSVNLHINPELRYGNSANGLVGLIPSNTVLFYPDDEGEAFDLSVNITKRWSNGTSLTLGKVNVLGPAKSLPISGGGGTAGFQNLAFALPPSAIVPGSIIGALLSVPTEKALFRVWVFDPDLQSQRSGLGDLFSNGVAGLASVTVPTKLAGKPGFFAVKVMGSTRSNIAARSLPPELIPAPGSGFGEKSGEFAGVLAAGQYLTGGPGPGGGIGIFGQVFASAGDPTFLDISGQLGIAGTPPGRPQDRFGLGWFRYSLTDGLIDALAQRVPLEDEEGIEAFYTLGLKEKLHLSINLQVVDSAVAPRNRGAIASMRLVAEF